MNAPQQADEHRLFDVPRGYITMITLAEPLSFDGTELLVTAGQLAGVPADAEIYGMRLERRLDHNGRPQYDLHVDWRPEQPCRGSMSE